MVIPDSKTEIMDTEPERERDNLALLELREKEIEEIEGRRLKRNELPTTEYNF